MSKDKAPAICFTISVNGEPFINADDLDKAVGFALSLHKTSNLPHKIIVTDGKDFPIIILTREQVMYREVFEVKTTISYLVSKAIEGCLTEYEDKVLQVISVLADSLLRHEHDLSHVTFNVSCSTKK